MSGFDPAYRNIVDYIVRITHRIWETDARNVDYIRDCYAPASQVFDDYGLQIGSEKIVADTNHTTGAFPTSSLTPKKSSGPAMTRSVFTPRISHASSAPTPDRADMVRATGKAIRVLVIANCVALGNDIFLEHVLYNSSAMLRQLGVDLEEEARRLATDPPAGRPRTDRLWQALRHAASPAKPDLDSRTGAGL